MKLNLLIQYPACSLQYNALVPLDLSVSQIIALFLESMPEGDAMYISHQEILFWKEQNLILHPDSLLGSYSIENGHHLLIL